MKLSLRTCRKQLAVLWLTGSGILFFVLLFQTILGRYSGAVDDAWGWLTPVSLD